MSFKTPAACAPSPHAWMALTTLASSATSLAVVWPPNTKDMLQPFQVVPRSWSYLCRSGPKETGLSRRGGGGGPGRRSWLPASSSLRRLDEDRGNTREVAGRSSVVDSISNPRANSWLAASAL